MAAAPGLIDLVGRLSLLQCRAEAARELAARLGAEELLLLVEDPELGVLIPAGGFPQTLRGGRQWRSFLARCVGPGRIAGEVDLPPETQRPALAVKAEGVALILLGGRPDEPGLAVLEQLLPLLGAVLAGEQRAAVAHAEASEAKDQASRAQALAKALEAARSEASKLNAELRQEHRRKDDFLAMLAHELRNPLAPLVTSIELLRRRGSDPELVEHQLDVMGRQVTQLSRLVEDLLDVSRVSHGRIELRRKRIRLRDVVADALDASHTLLEAREHEVVVSLPEEPLVVRADSVRLTQVFSNLLHNAAKYTDPGGRVTITGRRDGNRAEVRVEDTGVGIAPEMLPRIFDLFVQAPVALGRSQGGLGIGLTMVRSLVELHGGSVAAESAGPGAGSAFTVRLPLAATARVETTPVPALRSEAPAASLRVLVVDDNEDAADALADILRLKGHHVEVAYSGLAALQRAADLDADLMLLDIGLPDMDGYEIVRRLRRGAPAGTRFVALTGYGSREDKRRSRAAGFDEHLVKPISIELLEELLARSGPPVQEPAEGASNPIEGPVG